MDEERCDFILVMEDKTISPSDDCTSQRSMRKAVAGNKQRRT